MSPFTQLVRSFLGEGSQGVLVAQPVAGDRVVGMILQAVVWLDHTHISTLGRNSVAGHRVSLGNDGDAELGMHLGRCDGSAQSRTSATYEKDIVR